MTEMCAYSDRMSNIKSDYYIECLFIIHFTLWWTDIHDNADDQKTIPLASFCAKKASGMHNCHISFSSLNP